MAVYKLSHSPRLEQSLLPAAGACREVHLVTRRLILAVDNQLYVPFLTYLWLPLLFHHWYNYQHNHHYPAIFRKVPPPHGAKLSIAIEAHIWAFLGHSWFKNKFIEQCNPIFSSKNMGLRNRDNAALLMSWAYDLTSMLWLFGTTVSSSAK